MKTTYKKFIGIPVVDSSERVIMGLLKSTRIEEGRCIGNIDDRYEVVLDGSEQILDFTGNRSKRLPLNYLRLSKIS